MNLPLIIQATRPSATFARRHRVSPLVTLVWLVSLVCCYGTMLRAESGQDPLFGQSAGGFGQDFSFGALDNPYEFSATYELNPKTLKGRVSLTTKLSGKYHIFSTTQAPGGPSPTVIKIAGIKIAGKLAKLSGPFVPDRPPEVDRNSEFWPGLDVEQFSDKVTWTAPIQLAQAPGDKS
ncbi:MAG: hypothetical protein WCP62_01760, partial [Planctomycetota bacterium]